MKSQIFVLVVLFGVAKVPAQCESLTGRALAFAQRFSISTNMVACPGFDIPIQFTNGTEQVEIGDYILSNVVSVPYSGDDSVVQFSFDVLNRVTGIAMDGFLCVEDSPSAALANALNEATLNTMSDEGLYRLCDVYTTDDGLLIRKFGVGRTNAPPESVLLLRSNSRLYLSSDSIDVSTESVSFGETLFPPASGSNPPPSPSN